MSSADQSNRMGECDLYLDYNPKMREEMQIWREMQGHYADIWALLAADQSERMSECMALNQAGNITCITYNTQILEMGE